MGGRKDCAESPNDDADHVYPDPSMNRAEMMNWFWTNFGMTEQQVRLNRIL